MDSLEEHFKNQKNLLNPNHIKISAFNWTTLQVMCLISKTTKEVLEELPNLTDVERKLLAEKEVDGWYLFNNLSVDRLLQKCDLNILTAEYIVKEMSGHASYDIFPVKFAIPLEEALKPDFEKEEMWIKQEKTVAEWIAAHEEEASAKDD